MAGDARRVEESMQRAQRAMEQAMLDLERQEFHHSSVIGPLGVADLHFEHGHGGHGGHFHRFFMFFSR